MFGFYRVSSAVPVIRVADVKYNTEQIIKCIQKANNKSSALVIFPELCITGYTCGDLFHQSTLLNSAKDALYQIAQNTKQIDIVSAVGFPVLHNSSIYNCAAIIHKGEILGIVPKTNLPNYREFYEKRWFTPYTNFFSSETIELLGKQIPFGTNIIFELSEEFKLGVEICEDLWGVIPPSSYHVLAGATIIANLSASNELVGKSEYRRGLIRNQSAKCICGYIYSSSGVGESTSDVLYGGHVLTAENGLLIHENNRFQKENYISYSDIDCQRMLAIRTSESSIGASGNQLETLIPKFKEYRKIKISNINQITNIQRQVNPHPFVPSNTTQQDIRCSEIFSIQTSALAKRLEYTKAKKSVIGISGGLDSTLALLVTKVAHELIKKSPKDIIAITMPGFGTTDRTYNNAISICKTIGCDIREINIKDVCEEQFKLLNFNTSVKNTTYENVQARQRTMLLMNTANKEKGIVIGTGDLSEIALGWSTYNGDHMSMYAVNCGVPKTLIRYLIEWYANKSKIVLKKTLIDIINTPVSPELLPPDKQGKIAQKTEDIIGPYELHDFFLYHTVKYGAPPDKIKALANIAFKDIYNPKIIEKYLKTFILRFFSQQFKRNCIPDGPKVGTIALSPRGDWRMPPDASPAIWLDSFDKNPSL
jgi:NAD+ synthase (glutamine-hydrolysing)